MQQGLHRAKDQHFAVGLEPALSAGDHYVELQAGFLLESFAIATDRRHDAQIIKHHGSQIKDVISDFGKGRGCGSLQVVKFFARLVLIRIEEAHRDLGLKNEVGEGLRRAIVDLARDFAALLFLGVDDLFDDRRSSGFKICDFIGRPPFEQIQGALNKFGVALQCFLVALQLFKLAAHGK